VDAKGLMGGFDEKRDEHEAMPPEAFNIDQVYKQKLNEVCGEEGGEIREIRQQEIETEFKGGKYEFCLVLIQTSQQGSMTYFPALDESSS
jgi:hypothetical protein